ncbi:carbohydrate ABC transporter substrate-binding protein (CUT1 family) [Asanoa ferruginea]|uniref:Carbohydrate ABC transporter substrate-binding protein (CUT1 family) n=1 Tax=Asanoa ferruginea TaxID=53367 RepID=A0A3D9ZK74_9ACTN|nr:ABC transporter substrate-binding protein [Asanoa ferruginea]REF97607.1 carbohydrate ABC transporter substrate-binding protein (CUT1 family) [Asanoa ferruginea]GIF48707.1 ABC transporter substrate-binding protein [Asanoa ferruginea]
MVSAPFSRRGFLAGIGGVGVAGLLGACATGSNESAGAASTTLTLQSSLSDPDPKAALTKVVEGYSKSQVTLNTIAIETFRAQLPTYLNSGNPPDVLTWYAGSVARDYASKGFLLDVSDLWTGSGPCAGFSPALKELSTADGKQIFVPTNYYWWGVFYRKSAFQEWGVQVPTTWDEFIAVCKTIKSKGVAPISMGTGSTPWVASGWFDYLNLRINGADFHRELLSGKHPFDGPEVKTVMDHYRQLVEYIDPKGRSYSWQDAVTPLTAKKAGMYLIGAFITSGVPSDAVDDLDFFRVPIIDPSVPVAEEAPTDGYFASAKSRNPQRAKELLGYLASAPAQQQFIQLAKSSNLPTSQAVDTTTFAPLVQKGIKLLNESKAITQFFNRDSSDELQTTADTALTKFLDSPGDVNKILTEWQGAAKKVLGS